ncbi:hypothetical protein PAMP_014554 [Pampus punctatissimus]
MCCSSGESPAAGEASLSDKRGAEKLLLSPLAVLSVRVMSRVSGLPLLSRPLSASLPTRPTQVICKSAAKQPPILETREKQGRRSQAYVRKQPPPRGAAATAAADQLAFMWQLKISQANETQLCLNVSA